MHSKRNDVLANLSYKRRKAEQRAYVKVLKLGAGCLECGYNAFAEALEFDHVRGVKRYEITKSLGAMSHKTLLAEIAKCEIVCANCHRVRTAQRREPRTMLP